MEIIIRRLLQSRSELYRSEVFSAKTTLTKNIEPMIQSILIPKSWGLQAARKWIHDHYFKTGVVLEGNFYHFRQQEPNPYYHYSTVRGKNGMRFVVFYRD